MLAVRTDDGRFGPFRFTVGTEPGQWRPTPPAMVNDPNAWVARVEPFLIEDPADFRTDGPAPLTSRRYAKEFAEVKALGSLTSTARTADQTDAARFWAEGPAILTGVTRDLSAENELRLSDNARLFAMLYLTGADSLIACWDDKAYWSWWRPITAIHEAASDGNPATEADPSWLPLINNPPYPDHPSGLICVASAMHPLGHPLPERRRAGCDARRGGRALPRQALLPALALLVVGSTGRAASGRPVRRR